MCKLFQPHRPNPASPRITSNPRLRVSGQHSAHSTLTTVNTPGAGASAGPTDLCHWPRALSLKESCPHAPLWTAWTPALLRTFPGPRTWRTYPRDFGQQVTPLRPPDMKPAWVTWVLQDVGSVLEGRVGHSGGESDCASQGVSKHRNACSHTHTCEPTDPGRLTLRTQHIHIHSHSLAHTGAHLCTLGYPPHNYAYSQGHTYMYSAHTATLKHVHAPPACTNTFTSLCTQIIHARALAQAHSDAICTLTCTLTLAQAQVMYTHAHPHPNARENCQEQRLEGE